MSALPVRPDNLPSELLSIPHWVLWRYENRGSEKPTKVPYQIHGAKASSTDPKTWGDFDTVYGVYKAKGWDGIGFVLNGGSLTMVDLDDVGQAHPLVHELGSYAELSPSGNGIRILIRGTRPRGTNTSGHEIYSSARFMTLTGHRLNDHPIVDGQQWLDGVFSNGAGSSTTALSGQRSPGERHAALVSLAGSLRNRGMDPDEILPQLEAYNSSHCQSVYSSQELEKIARDAGDWEKGEPDRREVGSGSAYVVTDLKKVETQPVEWVDEPYVARGELHVLQGEGGSLKSFYTLMLAAEFSRRKEHVILINAEDSLEKKIKPALLAARADLDYVHPLSIRRGDDIDAVVIPDDLPIVRQAIVDYNTALVVIDPILTHISGKRDSYRDHEMKRVLTPIGRMAQETNAVVIAVHHTKKDTSGGLKTAGQASGAFYTTARVQLTMAKLPGDEEAVVEVTKSNIGPEGTRHLVRREPAEVPGKAGPISTIRLLRAGESPISAEEAIRGSAKDDRSRTVKARILMLDILETEGEQPQKTLFDRVATESGLKPGSVRREVYFGEDGLRNEDLVNGRKDGFGGDYIVYRTERERPDYLQP